MFNRLKKSLYRLKQAGRIWNKIIEEYLLSKRYEQLKSELSIFIRRVGSILVIIAVYIDDL